MRHSTQFLRASLAFAALSLSCFMPVAASAQVQADQPAVVADSSAQPYIISPDDQLNVTVLGHPDLNSAVTVLPDGTFNYPIAGSVHAAGLTVTQLTDRLVQGLSANLNTPRVTVTVVQSRPRRISVVGDVGHPGLYDIKAQWCVLDAIAACGGLVHVPEVEQATLVSEGGKKTTPIDVAKLMSGSDMSLNLPVTAGDILLVQLRDPSTSLVQVTGEVVKPGQYVVPATGAEILPILIQAGGATENAALSRVQILHAGQVKTVNLRQGMDDLSSPVNSVRLVQGDVLMVPTNKSKVAIMGEVKNPSVQIIPDGETMPVATALSLAGGLTDDGDKAKVDIVHQTPDGKPDIQVVNLGDSLASGNTAALNLKPGDVLYVPTRRKGHGIEQSGSLLVGLSAIWKLLL